MKSKDRIRALIKILEESNINSMEVSSFWGFTKIKLSKSKKNTSDITSISNNSINKDVSTPTTTTDINQNKESKTSQSANTDETPPIETKDQDLGYIQKAGQGTIYLKEICDLEPHIQGKITNFLPSLLLLQSIEVFLTEQ